MKRTTARKAALAGLTCLVGCGLLDILPTNPRPIAQPGTVFEIEGQRFRVESVVTGLEVPWAMGFSPDGSMLFVTERPGRLIMIDTASWEIVVQQRIDEVVFPLPRSERGLMGLAVSPDFDQDRSIFVSYTTPSSGGIKNIIDKFRFTGSGFERVISTPVVDNLPAAFIHDGLPLGFCPDGKLYASIGETAQAERAQDLDFLGGKFLRFNPDGTVPEDNPFGDSPVWSLGHRNPQGFAFHPQLEGVIISTEHGSSKGLDGAGGEDEVNRIIAGGNYGWPDLRGDETAEGFEAPLWNSGTEPIAPAGGTFCTGQQYPAWEDAFLFVGLRGASLWVVRLSEDATSVASIRRGLQDQFGRLRAITEGPDGFLYMTTSNRDTRGTPGPDDDRILRLVPVDD
jgi:glucose/arabinose dehydrogenase